MQLICKVWKKIFHYVQNYDLLSNITTLCRRTPYDVYDVIFRHMETYHFISVGCNSVTPCFTKNKTKKKEKNKKKHNRWLKGYMVLYSW